MKILELLFRDFTVQRKSVRQNFLYGKLQMRRYLMVRMPQEADVADIVTAFQNVPSFGATNFDPVAMYAPEQMDHAAVRDLNINQRL